MSKSTSKPATRKPTSPKAPARETSPKPSTRQKAATPPPEAAPATHIDAVETLPADMHLAGPLQERADTILGMVRQDVANAELGKFFALRAGVGMIVVKEMCHHGEWAAQMLRMLPGRTPRTLRRYMADARTFLDAKALMASDIWDQLASVGQAQLGAAAGRLLLGDGSAGGEAAADADAGEPWTCPTR